MRWAVLAFVLASASCPRHEPRPPLCDKERPEYLVPSCHLYVELRTHYVNSRND